MSVAATDGISPVLFYFDCQVTNVSFEGTTQKCLSHLVFHCPSKEKVERTFEAFIKLPKLFLNANEQEEQKIDSNSASNQNGNNENQIQKYSFKQVWPALKKWVGSSLGKGGVAVLVGHESYKKHCPILKKTLMQIGETIPAQWKMFCTEYLKNTLLIGANRSLPSLCHVLDIKSLDDENAYNNVLMVKSVFEKMIGSVGFSDILQTIATSGHPVIDTAQMIKAKQKAMLVFLAFKPTGQFPKAGSGYLLPKVIEVAGYCPETNSRFSSLVNPEREISKEMEESYGVSNKELEKAENFQRVWTNFEQWIDKNKKGDTDKVTFLAGHEIWGMDLKLLSSECKRGNFVSSLCQRYRQKRLKTLDIKTLSRSIFKGKKGLSHDLNDVRLRLKIRKPSSLRASKEVSVVNSIFKKFTKGLSKEEVQDTLKTRHFILNMKSLIKEKGEFKV